MRKSEISRKTSETDISLSLNLDGRGAAVIETGIGFLDHMLTLLAKHSRFDITLRAKGDIFVDDHHTAEDIGIVFGKAVSDALGNRAGIARYGDCILPMDESLILAAVDISGRGFLSLRLGDLPLKIGTFDTELIGEFWLSFARTAGITLHIRKLDGENAHHIVEGAFKSVARALRSAVAYDNGLAGEIPSTKGVLL